MNCASGLSMVIVEDGLGVTGESTCLKLEDSGTHRRSGAVSPERFFKAFEISLLIPTHQESTDGICLTALSRVTRTASTKSLSSKRKFVDASRKVSLIPKITTV